MKKGINIVSGGQMRKITCEESRRKVGGKKGKSKTGTSGTPTKRLSTRQRVSVEKTRMGEAGETVGRKIRKYNTNS